MLSPTPIPASLSALVRALRFPDFSLGLSPESFVEGLVICLLLVAGLLSEIQLCLHVIMTMNV